MAEESRPSDVVDQFAILIATVRALILNREAKPLLLETYDSVNDHLLNALRAAGFTAEELMELERNIARLRLALDELRSAAAGP